MSTPAYVGMPPQDSTFQIGAFGEIRCGGRCRDDYARIQVFHDAGGRLVVLQSAALTSFKAAEHDCGFAILLTGSHRSCSQQTMLYRSDSQRFADPDVTAHTRGLAIDVSQSMSSRRLKKVHVALSERHWYQSRPDSERWHYSFGLKV